MDVLVVGLAAAYVLVVVMMVGVVVLVVMVAVGCLATLMGPHVAKGDLEVRLSVLQTTPKCPLLAKAVSAHMELSDVLKCLRLAKAALLTGLILVLVEVTRVDTADEVALVAASPCLVKVDPTGLMDVLQRLQKCLCLANAISARAGLSDVLTCLRLAKASSLTGLSLVLVEATRVDTEAVVVLVAAGCWSTLKSPCLAKVDPTVHLDLLQRLLKCL